MQHTTDYIRFENDCVAIAKTVIPVGTQLDVDEAKILITTTIPKGHRFALCDILVGEFITQFGYPFAQSQGVTQGELLTVQNTVAHIPESRTANFLPPPWQ